MTSIFRKSIYCLAVALAGCVTVTPLSPPISTSAETTAYIAARLPTEREKFSATSVPNSYFGVSGASGSLAAGLLLGPIGALINYTYAQSKNTGRASSIGDLFALDLADTLHTAVPTLQVQVQPQERQYALVPAANIIFIDDKSFNVFCTLNVELPSATDKPWRARYIISPDTLFSVDSSQTRAEVASVLSSCLGRAYELFREHVSGRMGSSTVKEIKTKSFTYTLSVNDGKLPGRVIGNDELGLIEFRRSDVLEVK
ncbi:MAG: hypothetical protein WCK63_14235 [Betaproteobacteria bacterium]